MTETETGLPDCSGAPRKRPRPCEMTETETGLPDCSGAPRKRPRPLDAAAEGLPEPEPKRANGAAADADLMALLDRIDSMDGNNSAYPEHQQDGMLSGAMKSLAEELGLEQQQQQQQEEDEDNPAAGQDPRRGDVMAGEFNFFLDAAEEDRYAMNQLACVDHYAQAWTPDDVDYAEVAEFLHGPLWEDDTWQPQDAGEIPQPLL